MFQIRDYSHCEPDTPEIDDLIFGEEKPHSEK